MRSENYFSISLFLLFLYLSISKETNIKNGALVVVQNEEEDEEADVTVIDAEKHQEKVSDFKPTNEWKEIKEGQAIPPGLHVRLNLQTGEKEAKLLDSAENADKQFLSENSRDNRYEFWSTENGRKGIINKQSKKFSPEELREALKSFKAEEYEGSTEEDIKRVRESFRSIEDLKREFSELNIDVKTDVEILIDQVKKYQRATDQQKTTILQDMEFLVHQYDVAQDFVKMGGLEIILPDLNSTNSGVRALVAFTLGSAMQGNPRVQIAVLESNAMQHLLRLVALDPVHLVQTRALYAISCLLRHFPLAQQRFIENGGLTALAELFKHSTLQTLKLQLKVVTLLHDLVTEQQLAEKHTRKDDKSQQEKLRQYRSFHLQEAVVQNGFCNLIPKLLQSPDFDTQEKVINAMLSIVELCKYDFSKNLQTLHNLAAVYKAAALGEKKGATSSGGYSVLDGGDYFTVLHNSIETLITRVQKQKDEL